VAGTISLNGIHAPHKFGCGIVTTKRNENVQMLKRSKLKTAGQDTPSDLRSRAPDIQAFICIREIPTRTKVGLNMWCTSGATGYLASCLSFLVDGEGLEVKLNVLRTGIRIQYLNRRTCITTDRSDPSWSVCCSWDVYAENKKGVLVR
jgi:hypothetical protein